MKKITLLIALFMLCQYSVKADSDTLLQNHFIYVTGTSGEAGSTAELTLNIHNNNPIKYWKCDLILPEGFTLKSVVPVKDRWPEGYEPIITTNANEDGSVTIFNNDAEDVSLTGTDGPVATVTVDIANTVSSGKYTITLRNIYLEQPNGTIIWKEYTEFKWTIMGGNMPFVEEGKVWNMRYHNVEAYDIYPDYEFNYFIEGDTLIAGNNCKKLYSFNESNDNKTEYKMALHESDGKVYFIPNGSTESYLLYDFLIPVGSSVVTANPIKPEWEIEMRNNKDKLLEMNGVYRHCLYVNRVNLAFEDYPSGWWIEGIGSELGPFNTWGFEAGGNNRLFLSCEVNGQIIFTPSDFQTKLTEPDEEINQEYYPDGTKWTEIRLDTLKYDSWYSKVGDEWVPNFETIEYSCGGKYINWFYSQDNYSYHHYVYTNSPDWSDVPALMIYEEKTENDINISAAVPTYGLDYFAPGDIYQFNWYVGKKLYYQEMIGIDDVPEPDMTGPAKVNKIHPEDPDDPDFPVGPIHEFGTIEEIKEGDFGGVKPLKYVDLNGVRIIHGVGVTEWNDGECLLGPANLYNNSFYFKGTPQEHHYRSMLVHFERDGEVLYDVWPRKESSVEVAIDGLNYYLDFNKHEAIIDRDNTWSGELDIPSEVIYEGQRFVVKSMIWCAFANCPELTRVRIPKTIESVTHHVLNGMNGAVSPDHMNPFMGCTALESVEVDEENPSFKSVDGVFFSQDGKGQYYIGLDYFNGTGLYCYPAGKKQESYIIPEGVEWIGATAFEYSQHLTTLTIPSTMICIYGSAFKGCSNLTDVYCNAENVPKTNKQAFTDCPLASATLHVPAGSVDLYKSTYPWSEFGNIVAMPEEPAQPQPFLEGNPIWVFKYEHIPVPRVPDLWCWVDTGDRYYTYYFLGGQKEIEGKIYTMMGEVIRNREGGIIFNRWLPVREENGIVYAITDSLPGFTEDDYDSRYHDEHNPMPYQQQGNECVLYNFNTEIGETLYPQNGGSTVESYGTYQLMDGTECRVLKTRWEFYDLCEKLGFLKNDQDFGIMDPLLSKPVSTNGHVYVNHLNAYYQNNTMLYKAPDPQEGLCVNDTCWTRDEAVAYATSYKADPYQDEVMAYIRQLQGAEEPVTYTKDQMATIILPTEPDASKGKYYRLDRCEDNQIIFEQELQPQARVPYVIVPNEDFTIDPSTLNLEGLTQDEVFIEGVSFIGSYHREELSALTGGDGEGSSYIDLIDTTSDCGVTISAETGKEVLFIGALRAYLIVSWDDPINPGGARSPKDKLEIVLKDFKTGVGDAQRLNDKGQMKNDKWYDLQGRRIDNSKFIIQNSSQSSGAGGAKLPRGIYIKDKKKVLY